MRPKVLVLSPVVPYPPTDGGRLRTFKLCKYLSSTYDITILAKVSGDDIVDLSKISKAFASRVQVIPVFSGAGVLGHADREVRPRLLSMMINKWLEWSDPWRGMPYRTRYDIDEEFKAAIEQCLKDTHYDIFQAEHLYMLQYLSALRLRPIVLSEIDIETRKMQGFFKNEEIDFPGKRVTRQADRLIYELKKRWQLSYVKKLESELAKHVDICIAMSPEENAILKSWNEDLEVITVPNGVDVTYFEPSSLGEAAAKQVVETPTLIFSGHMGYLPNEHAVLRFTADIFPLIKREIPEANFVIVGKQPSLCVRALGKKDDSITVTGFVEDVRPYLCCNAVYIAPINFGSGTRIKILEAMAMQMAVVSTSMGCEGLDVESGKNILIADSPADFAKAVVRLIEQPRLRQDLGLQARALVEEKYDWQEIAKAQDAAYRRLLDRRYSDASALEIQESGV